MRTMIIMATLLALGVTAALQAQDADEEVGAEDTATESAETFAPTEEVAADTAVAFPTDI